MNVLELTRVKWDDLKEQDPEEAERLEAFLKSGGGHLDKVNWALLPGVLRVTRMHRPRGIIECVIVVGCGHVE
jgi:hypothetical protein